MTDQKKQLWVILIIVFLGILGVSMPYLIFPALFLNPEYSILPAGWEGSSSAIFLGLTLAAYPLGQFIGSPILGSLSDEYGRKKLLAGSLFIAAFCNLLTGFAIEWHSLWLLISSRFATGVMEGNIAIARAMAADLKAIPKNESFGKINVAISIAFLLGPLLGSLLTDKNIYPGFTISTPFYIICLLFLFVAILSLVVLKKRPKNIEVEKRSFLERINIIKRIFPLLANKKLKFLLITSTLFTLAIDIYYEFGPVYLTVKWSLSPSDLIIYNAVLCLTLAIGNGWLPRFFSTPTSSHQAIIWSIEAFALLLIGIVLVNTPSLMITFFALAGLFIGLALTLITVRISDSVSDTVQGEVMGVQFSLRVLGDAIICLIGGGLLLLSPKIILVVAIAISLAAATYYAMKNKFV